ncbi:hypothetical protein T4D_6018 [Trichinella pseudospiralis]|nr:hypothetical protein T4D_6018 [Trichinella pseudospiralis]
MVTTINNKKQTMQANNSGRWCANSTISERIQEMTTVLRSAKYNARKSSLKEREKANSEVNGAWSQLLNAPPASTILSMHVKLKAGDDDLSE